MLKQWPLFRTPESNARNGNQWRSRPTHTEGGAEVESGSSNPCKKQGRYTSEDRVQWRAKPTQQSSQEKWHPVTLESETKQPCCFRRTAWIYLPTLKQRSSFFPASKSNDARSREDCRSLEGMRRRRTEPMHAERSKVVKAGQILEQHRRNSNLVVIFLDVKTYW